MNGDATGATPCASDGSILCLDDTGPILTDAAGAPIPAFNGAGPYAALNTTATTTERWGAALQLVSSAPIAGLANDLTLGASLDAGRTAFRADTLLGQMTAERGFGGPGIAVDQRGGPIAPVGLIASTRYFGVYLTDTAHLTPALAVTMSGRFDRADLKLADQLGTALNGDHRFDRLTDFFVADPPLKLVTAGTWETGLRGRYRRPAGLSLNWSVGLYRTEVRNDISRVASNVFGRGFFENVGRTRRQGVEAQADVASGHWRGFVTYAFTDATFQTPLTLASPDNPGADANGLIHVRPGDHIPDVVRHRAKVGVSYDAARWRLALDATASSSHPLSGDQANLTPPAPGYVVVNLSGSWRLTRSVELFGAVENLTDRHYATGGAFAPTASVALVEAPGASNPRSLTPAPPRSVEAGLRISF
jgi:outer membrane receptor protein involved in Fe transport